mmetsp:Transcript_24757/g.58932  ORF Transcript_24757/g.58932 Transcript_24757/m.58932 type:complete len:208 (-) Transcript_24757:16-639(-)
MHEETYCSTLLEHALGGGDARTSVKADGLAERNTQRLECRLRLVVVVLALEVVNVQRDAPLRRERLHNVRDHLARELPDHLPLEVQLDVRRGPRGDVHNSARKGLVERTVGASKPADVLPVSKRLVERLANHHGAVLRRVVVADVQVALALEGEINAAVLGHSAEHVVEEPDAGVDVILADAVEVDLAGDLRFLGLARDARGARRPG